MSSRKRYDSSSSESSYHVSSKGSRRRLPSPPSGILRNTNRHVTIVDPSAVKRRVDRIVGSLEDTNRNIESVDAKLDDYKSLHDDSMSALTKVRLITSSSGLFETKFLNSLGFNFFGMPRCEN